MATQRFTNIRRQLAKRVPTDDGLGYGWINDGTEIADVDVTVNFAQIARDLGSRAMKNKSGKSKYMGGAIVVTALNRRKGDQS